MTLLSDFWSLGHLELALLALVGRNHLQSESKTRSVYRALETVDLRLLRSRGQTPDQKVRDPSKSTRMGNCRLQLVCTSILLSFLMPPLPTGLCQPARSEGLGCFQEQGDDLGAREHFRNGWGGGLRGLVHPQQERQPVTATCKHKPSVGSSYFVCENS